MLTTNSSAQDRLPYQDASQSIETRVDDLLARMTLDEKVAQLLCLWDSKPEIMDTNKQFVPEKATALLPDGIGCLARPSDMTGQATPGVDLYRGPRETANLVNAIQRWAIEETRLGIPLLMHEEGLHGMQSKDATHFPQAIALASMWDVDLIEQIYTIVAREIRVRGAHHVLSPVIDVARDSRWGRIEETYGEDPYLVSRIGVAAVIGFQGDTMPIAQDRVLATLKHMTGHGQPESGTNVGPAQISERTLREMFFPPFEAAVREANAASVMASYNEIDGIPSHANTWLLGDILRGEWGFDGFIVADYYAIAELERRHSVAANKEEAAQQALAAGVDLELPNWDVYRLIPYLVNSGELDLALVDLSVRRLLTAKFQAGLFEHPYADPDEAEAITGNAEARALALESARKAITLLKNEDNMLPLDASVLNRIAVVGPNAAETILGGYSDFPKQTVSILDGIRAYVGNNAEVVHAQGVQLTESRNWWADEVVLGDPQENRTRIAEAVRVAQSADVAIVVVGDNEQTSREAWAESHPGDRTSLTLLAQQDDLVQAVVETGVPTVVILIHGRPLAINYIAENVPAILDGWYLGQETGTAVAEALFGDVNPGGKLPVTIPRNVGQLPMFYNYKPTARRAYLFDETTPLFPFGFGLSYTTFAFQDLRLSQSTISTNGSVNVLVDVVNTGQRAGDEVVQLYIRDDVSSVTRPVKELKGFQRITLQPGERKTVTLTLTPAHLSMFNRAMKRVVEPGTFTLMVGPNSVDLQTITLTVE